MKKITFILLSIILIIVSDAQAKDRWPDGTEISKWFRQNDPVDVLTLGKQYVITDYGVKNDSTIIQTEQLQAVIDKAAKTGGVIVIPKGVFLSGSLFFKQGTHLHLQKDATLKGSDDISNFPIRETRIEGQTLNYFSAFINADNLDGFSISGEGTINGNGERYWKSFWLRRKVNPKCTNIEELRPRLIYISNCKNVQISGVHLINSPFWTTHLYKSENVKLLNLYIFSPRFPIKAPSSDAVDIDVCKNIHIKNCYMSVNDDAVALKGGKGPKADKDPTNGENRNILIEDCEYGFCHGALTCGSESIHNYNILLRRIIVRDVHRLLWLKMRPDTPQNYEYITVEDIKGFVDNFIYIKPWTQFFDLKGQESMPLSYSSNITMKNIDLECSSIFNIDESDQYQLQDFTFENLNLEGKDFLSIPNNFIQNIKVDNVKINGNKL